LRKSPYTRPCKRGGNEDSSSPFSKIGKTVVFCVSVPVRRRLIKSNSAATLLPDGGALKPPSRRVAFVLLREMEPAVLPIVFSGEDGAFYNYQWSNRKADLEKEIERVQNRFKSFAQGYFAEEIEPFTCDKCESRIACPHWLKALA
jgi:hypothetical protein